MAADYPLIGLGPGAWVKRSALYTRDSVVNTFYFYRQYAHHDLLQFAAEWGVLPALVALYQQQLGLCSKDGKAATALLGSQVLLRNLGNGRFADVSQASGLAAISFSTCPVTLWSVRA